MNPRVADVASKVGFDAAKYTWFDFYDVPDTIEEELKNAVKQYEAKSGTVVVLNPKTGGIIAMATFPTFDPKHYKKYVANYFYKTTGKKRRIERDSVLDIVAAGRSEYSVLVFKESSKQCSFLSLLGSLEFEYSLIMSLYVLLILSSGAFLELSKSSNSPSVSFKIKSGTMC
jgi:cell division protein FtsI/penicillin-binding protein 2